MTVPPGILPVLTDDVINKALTYLTKYPSLARVAEVRPQSKPSYVVNWAAFALKLQVLETTSYAAYRKIDSRFGAEGGLA